MTNIELQAEINEVIDILEEAILKLDRLQVSHDRLLAAAWEALNSMSPTGHAQDALRAAIAAAEEQAP